MPWNPDDGGEEEGAHQERRRRGGINLSVVFDLDFIKSLAGVLLIIQIVSKYCYASIRDESINNASRDINVLCYIQEYCILLLFFVASK